jgi:hypothetical protein
MHRTRRISTSIAAAIFSITFTACEQPKPAEAPMATTQSTPANVNDSILHARAMQAVIWGMPAVNYDLMYQAMLNQAHGGPNQIVFWSKFPDWKNQTLTPNPNAIYLMPFINTKDAGPMVLEIPPASSEGSITGNLDDAWQIALEDIGPAGADKGKGGKYLILPPGYKEKPPAGYLAMPSDTYQNYALLRSIPTTGSEADVAKALAYGKRVKLYPLSQAAHPPDTRFVDATNVTFDSTIPYDLRYFESLNRIVQFEPWLERDKAMIDPLKSIGIEKGKPFNPDSAMQNTLKQAAAEAHAWLDAKYETIFAPYFDGGHWAVPGSPEAIKGQSDFYADPNSYAVDARAVTYSIGFIGIKHLGGGQFYLISSKDKDGKPLSGAVNYRLHVPANAPVKQFWSVTAYDRATHALILNMPRASRASNDPGLQKNADGSVDIYFGPKAPDGKDSNWVPTDPARPFELLVRLYGPTESLFDKTWKLPDPEKQ